LKLCKRKQPTTELRVLKALNEIIRENKTKLKTEKVELVLADDITKTVIEQYNSLNESM
jgi:hypothetical protein